jgi:preprotein translocase subunit SecG
MLSYIRESQTEALDQGDPQNGALGGSDQVDSDSTFLTISGRDQSVRKSTVFVTSLFILASIGLVMMAKRSHIQTAGATPAVDSKTQIEMAISRVTGVSSEMTLRMDEIVQKFYEFSDVFQVKVADLNKNPFQLALAPVDLEVKEKKPVQEKPVASLLSQFNVDKKGLSLICIMKSESSTCCMINGMLLEVGQSVGVFLVEDIQSDHVQLVWQPEGHVPTALERDSITVTLALKD